MIHKFNPMKTKRLRSINGILKIFFHTEKAKLPIRLQEMREILIIDPTLIGDIVMLIPFLKIVKRNIPSARITLVCGRWGEEILQYQHLADDFVIIQNGMLSSLKSMVKNAGKILRLIRLINDRSYDIAVEPRGDLRYIFFMHFCNAKRKVSYNYTGGECLLTDVVMPSDRIEHLVEDKLYLLKQLGGSFAEEDVYPKLYLTEQQKKENDEFIKANHLKQKRIVGIHPGASMHIREWFGFTELLERLENSKDNLVFMIFEGPNDKETTDKVLNAGMKCNAEIFHVKTDISHYMQKIALCDVMICNDSGAAHIAAAYGVETFVIFGPVSPQLSRPYSNKGVHIFSNDSLVCKPCLSSSCKFHHECIDSISVGEVANGVIGFLQQCC